MSDPAPPPGSPASAPAVSRVTEGPAHGRLWILALLAVLLLAAGLRAYQMDRRSLWLDEVYTLALTTGRDIDGGQPVDTLIAPPPPRLTGLGGAEPVWKLPALLGGITHPSVYFVLLRMWREVFGEGDTAARALSAVFSVIAVLLIFDVGRLLWGRWGGFWAAVLLAVAVPQVSYAQEARNYTIQLVFALAAAGALLGIERSGPTWPRLLGLGASLLLLVMSHYFAVGAAAALGLYALLHLHGRARRDALLTMLACAGLFLILWGPVMWQQRAVMVVGPAENPWFFDATPGRPLRAVANTLLIPALLLSEPVDELPGPSGYVLALLYVLPLLLWRRRPDLRLPALWLLCTVGIILALDIARSSIHLTYIRYTLLAGPGVYLLLAGLLARPRAAAARGHEETREQAVRTGLGGRLSMVRISRSRLAASALPALAAVSCLLALPAEYRGAYPDWREPPAYLAEHVRPGDIILSSSEGGWGYEAWSQVLFISHYMGDLPGPLVIAPERPSQRLLEELRASGRTIWLITPGSWIDPAEVLPGAQIHSLAGFRGVAEIWRAEWDQAGAAHDPLERP